MSAGGRGRQGGGQGRAEVLARAVRRALWQASSHRLGKHRGALVGGLGQRRLAVEEVDHERHEEGEDAHLAQRLPGVSQQRPEIMKKCRRLGHTIAACQEFLTMENARGGTGVETKIEQIIS